MNRAQRRKLERMSQKEFLKIQQQTLKKLKKDFPNANLSMDDLKGLKDKYQEIANLESEYNTLDNN